MIIQAKVEGMMCNNCEMHTENAIKEAFKVNSVKADHEKNLVVIDTDEPIDEKKLAEVIDEEGYSFKGLVG